jgi:Calcineurin-like phosphoesterase
MPALGSEVQFQIVSDLHLESPGARPTYREVSIDRRCPNLALLGDIGNVKDADFFRFLEKQLETFEIVFFLLGNHEPYEMTLEDAKVRITGFEADHAQRKHADPKLGTFVWLDNKRFDLTANISVLGCTLFSEIAPLQEHTVEMFVSDFQNIQDWSVKKHNIAHTRDLAQLNEHVATISKEEPHRRVVIFTHHSPTIQKEANDPRHLTDEHQVRSAFCTDLSNEICWTSPQVVLWAFGHTHFNCDFQDPSTGKRVLANQKGYRRSENGTYDPDKIIVIPRRPISDVEKKEVADTDQATEPKLSCCRIF